MIFQKYPEPIVGALIISPEGKVLLLKSHKWKGHYTVPGGHIESGEKIEDAIKREIKEETGLDVFDIEFLNFQEYIHGDTYYKKKHFIFLDFVCKTNSTEVKLNEEGLEHAWIFPNELSNLPIEPYTKRFIENYLKKKGDKK